jgi:hypothetical protein
MQVIRKTGFLIILLALLSSCGPSIYYLGDEYSRSRNVQVFYDEVRIDEPYTVIGRMTNDQKKNYKPDRIREQMIRKAKRYGADAIVFTNLSVDRLERKGEDRVVVEAKLLKFR